MELIQDELCDIITASVERLAQEKSPQKLTVRDVLKDLGITNRVFYNRFHSIDEVLAIIYSRSVTQVRRALRCPGTDMATLKNTSALWRAGRWS